MQPNSSDHRRVMKQIKLVKYVPPKHPDCPHRLDLFQFHCHRGMGEHYIGPVGRLTLLAGTMWALSAMRRGPDPNRPMRRAFFETGTNPYS